MLKSTKTHYENIMGSGKDKHVKPQEWHKHFREFASKIYWGRSRQKSKEIIKEQLKENNMEKTIRNLSGVYFRHQVETGKWSNIVFEDLPEFKQDKILAEYTKEQVISLCKTLANTLNDIGDAADIVAE